jgi:hypothetical protein
VLAGAWLIAEDLEWQRDVAVLCVVCGNSSEGGGKIRYDPDSLTVVLR